ncbi:MAG: hypothetical protein IKX54_06055 [Lachnospiraceae bacterium]|nr:hypothetical protein [Lachnospiraceae bacterium]
MGLDVYAGTLTRYYARNWKTIVQQWGEANGYQVNVVRSSADGGETASPEVILQAVTGWRDQLIGQLGGSLKKKPLWKEDNDATPYYTDKPDWSALHALMLYVICKVNGQEVPVTVPKSFGLLGTTVYDEFMKKNPSISLMQCDCWWLPFGEDFMFRYILPTGQEHMFATVGKLKEELRQINAIEWNADEETIIGWRDAEGYPEGIVMGADKKVKTMNDPDRYNTVSLAKFAFSILWQAVKHSEQHGTLIIFDY